MRWHVNSLLLSVPKSLRNYAKLSKNSNGSIVAKFYGDVNLISITQKGSGCENWEGTKSLPVSREKKMAILSEGSFALTGKSILLLLVI